MYDYNKYCIVCNKFSNGYPQCKECWQMSQEYEEELESTPKYTKYWNSLNSILEKTIANAKREKNKTKLTQYCNEIIGIGFLANNFYMDGDELLEDLYDEVEQLIKNKNINSETISKLSDNTVTIDFRKQNPANIYCQDGHYVRSKEERAIDDYLYKEAKLLHAYEPKFRLTPQEQSICKKYGYDFEYFYPDFFIPVYNLYIEFFGKNDEQYKQKMDLKIKIFSSRKDINFKFLTYNDSNLLLEKLEDILEFYKLKYK